jgi:hypothetical protein
MTTSQKYDYKTKEYCKVWDPTMSITAYSTSLDMFRISLNNCGILTSVEEKMIAVDAQMWESEIHEGPDGYLTQKNRPAANQTWNDLQRYFIETWLKQCQYLVAMAKQSQLKEVVLVAQEQAAAEEEGEMQAMMFALLQEQHKSHLEAMVAANKAIMDAIVEQMNIILMSVGGRRSKQDNENTPPTTNANKVDNDKAKKVKHKNKLCPHCNILFSTSPTGATSWT